MGDASVRDASTAVDSSASLEERFDGQCRRWHNWRDGESVACEECRSSRCAALAFRAELVSGDCPGEFECVQDGCYPDGTASSIECGCVLTCLTVASCRDVWLAAMECVTTNCSEACGEVLE